MKKHWYHYLWLWSLLFFEAGLFNIMFAWLGLISFILPLVFAFGFGTKGFCNRYCDRGQFLRMFGGQLGLSRNHEMPGWKKGRALPTLLLCDTLPLHSFFFQGIEKT